MRWLSFRLIAGRSTPQANQYDVTTAGESTGQPLNRVFERHRVLRSRAISRRLARLDSYIRRHGA